MPHRIIQNTAIGTAIEAALIGAAAGYKIASEVFMAFTEQDWSRFMGPQGFTVGLILAVVVLWGNGIARERNETRRREKEEAARAVRHSKEETAREDRHRETIGLQKENSEKLRSITVESILAQGKFAIAMNRLVDELSDRPCNSQRPLTAFMVNLDQSKTAATEPEKPA